MTDPLRDQLKATLGDAYDVERELGGGGMARVFVARERALDRKVVVKTLAPHVAAEMSAERFRREIRLAASLQQANILPVLSAGETNGLPYYTMPFVEGDSLRVHMTAHGASPVQEAVGILRDVARALSFAHEHGVVHRDIKPENVLLSGSTAVVIDFGIAKAIESSRTQPGGRTLTHAGTALGTPAYLSPEQASGDPDVDHRADIYAFGVLAYELITGVLPFKARTPQALLAAHLRDQPLDIATHRGNVPAALATLIMRCLEKEPERRPQSGREILELLESGSLSVVKRRLGIAVLPFANMSDADDEYFSDGITEDIIAHLSRFAGLKVIARTSMMRYKRTDKGAREIAIALDVSHIVEGSVRRAGNRLRVVGNLIDGDSEATIWAETFDRELTDVFAVQSELSERIAGALKTRLTTHASSQPTRRRATDSVEAYDAYLRGRFYRSKGTTDSYHTALQHFERALSLDPHYAEAHLGAADVLCEQAVFAGDSGRRVSEARAQVMKAIDLNPQLAGAHATLGYINFWFDWDWSEAERRFVRALELEPDSVMAHDYYVTFLSNLGRLEEALAYCRRLIELDPLWPHSHQALGWVLFQSGRFGEAVPASSHALELAPDYAIALLVKGFSLLELADYTGALAVYQQCIATSPAVSLAQSGVVQTQARMGDREGARRTLREMLSLAASGTMEPSYLAWAHCALGDTEEAFACVERMVREHDAMTVCLPTFSWWDPLRSDARFRSLLERLRFPAWALAASDARITWPNGAA